jgi:DNA adenine methylase
MYLDPPYIPETRGFRNIYGRHEMNDEDHIRLCATLTASRAKIVLSGYDNELYDSCLPHFNKTRITSVDEAGNQKTEVIWRNFSEYGNLF